MFVAENGTQNIFSFGLMLIVGLTITLKAPNTTKDAFANTVNPDETAHNEPSHLDLQCLPSSL